MIAWNVAGGSSAVRRRRALSREDGRRIEGHNPVTGMPSDVPTQIAAAEARLAELDRERDALLHRLAHLRGSADAYSRSEMSPAEKVELFGSLFRGRPDVYALRWESARSGRAGYSPKCANEWDRTVCEKPKVRCADCSHQAFAPADAVAIGAHLRGRAVMGIYPLLADETCWLLAIDFDGGSWHSDVRAFRSAAVERGLTPAIERSRSGSGAHVWFFFTEPVAAAAARRLGTSLLSGAMARTPSLAMSSYDRLFPSQDTMPAGGFGNLIALPLQWSARQQDNSVFLDADLEPHDDQWAYLRSLPRITPAKLASLVEEADGLTDGARDSIAPWRPVPSLAKRLASSDMPERVAATLADRLYVDRTGMSPTLVDAVRRLAAFSNPVFGERQAMRLSTALTPRVIACFEDLPQHIVLPRGCAQPLEDLFRDVGVRFELDDQRLEGAPVQVEFTGDLTPAQRDALKQLRRHDIGVLCAPPGSGKTVVAINVIAARARSTLVIVNRQPLVEQWHARLHEFLDVEPGAVGTITGRSAKPTGHIDIATVQTLARAKFDRSVLTRYGHVVVDECHHVPAASVERVLASCPARFVTGLTATPYRRDGHHPIITMQCGPVRHTMSGETRHRIALRVIRRGTAFDPGTLPENAGIQEVFSALAADCDRADLIVADVLSLLADGRAPIVLTERRAHLELLADRLRPAVPQLAVLHGDVTPRHRRAALEALAELPPSAPRLLLATGRFIGEGFDDPRLDTLVLAMPIAWKGTIIQYAGRLHRPYPGKHDALIYDYVDDRVPVLRRMFAKRAKAYQSIGYRLDDTEARHVTPAMV